MILKSHTYKEILDFSFFKEVQILSRFSQLIVQIVIANLVLVQKYLNQFNSSFHPGAVKKGKAEHGYDLFL